MSVSVHAYAYACASVRVCVPAACATVLYACMNVCMRACTHS